MIKQWMLGSHCLAVKEFINTKSCNGDRTGSLTYILKACMQSTVFYEIFHCHLVLAAEINDVQPVRATFNKRKRKWMMTAMSVSACSDALLDVALIWVYLGSVGAWSPLMSSSWWFSSLFHTTLDVLYVWNFTHRSFCWPSDYWKICYNVIWNSKLVVTEVNCEMLFAQCKLQSHPLCWTEFI